MTFEIGDWVQAVHEVTEADFMGVALWIHAHAGAIGHVVGLETWADGTVMPDIHWEHTGTGTLVDPDMLRFLCDAEGSAPRTLRISAARHESSC